MKWLVMLSVVVGFADTKSSISALRTFVGSPKAAMIKPLNTNKLQEITEKAQLVIKDMITDQKNKVPLLADDVATILWAGYRIQSADNSSVIREQVYYAIYENLQNSGDDNKALLLQALELLGPKKIQVEQMYKAYQQFLNEGADHQ